MGKQSAKRLYVLAAMLLFVLLCATVARSQDNGVVWMPKLRWVGNSPENTSAQPPAMVNVSAALPALADPAAETVAEAALNDSGILDKFQVHASDGSLVGVQKRIVKRSGGGEMRSLRGAQYDVELVPLTGPVRKLTLHDAIGGTVGVEEVAPSLPAPRGVNKWLQVYAIDPTKAEFANATVTVIAQGTTIYKCREWDFAAQRCKGEWAPFLNVTPGQEYSFTLTPEDPGFGDASPDIGTPDLGYHTGTYSTTTGNYTNAQTANSVYFSVERASGAAASANQTLGYNITILTANTSRIITGLNGSITYCHARRATSGCGATGAQGTARGMNILLQNASSGAWVVVGALSYPGTSALHTTGWSLNTSYDVNDFINSSGYVNVRYEFSWSGTGQSAFLNDYAPITVLFLSDDEPPQVLLDAPPEAAVANTGVITLNCSATDDLGLQNLTLYHNLTGIWHANKTAQIIGTTNSTGATFSGISDGSYAWSCSATDAVGKIATATTRTFTIDSRAPEVTSLSPAGASHPRDSIIELGVNITDASGIDAASANITRPDGSSSLISLAYLGGARYQASYSSTDLLGRYNISILANDTIGNSNGSVTSYFFVYDAAAPLLANATPDNASFTRLTGVLLRVNATDDAAVSAVSANITLPDASVIQLPLSPNGGWYEALFGSTSQLGLYRIRFIANDSSGNRNSSVNTSFTIIDALAPNVTSVSPAGSSAAVGAAVEISANVSDDIAVHTVFAAVTIPNNTVQQLPLLLIGGLYRATFASTSTPGRYNFTIFANDTSANLNSTQQSYFFIVDNAAPRAVLLAPQGAAYNISNIVNITSNASDDVEISMVAANITMPNGSTDVVALILSDGLYRATYGSTPLPGRYNITIWANDTSGNTNTSGGYFTVADVFSPNATILSPPAGSSSNIGSIVPVTVNASDDVLVTSVSASITLPNGSTEEQMLNDSGGLYRMNFTSTQTIGRYNLSIFVNDSSDNTRMVQSYFLVNDVAPPQVIIAAPLGEQSNISDSIAIIANISDDVAAASAWATVLLPNGSLFGISLQQDGNLYRGNFTTTTIVGRYNITVFANDTSGNMNLTQSFFLIRDVVAPQAAIIVPLGDTVPVGGMILLSANISDDVALASAIFNITAANGTTYLRSAVLDDGLYRSAFGNTTLPGQYNITLEVLDFSGNANSSSSYFIVLDIFAPAVSLIAPANGSLYPLGSTVVVAANATDDVAVASVVINITFPNGTALALPAPYAAGQYVANFTGINVPGRYNISIVATDTSANTQTTQAGYFLGQDVLRPAVGISSPAPGTISPLGVPVVVAANVSDDIGVSVVRANITLPNGSTILLATAYSEGLYSGVFASTTRLGRYNVTIIANDTSANQNATVQTYFLVSDQVAPAVHSITPAGLTFNQSAIISIAANVSDDWAVAAVSANVTLPNTSVVQLLLSYNGGVYRANLSATQLPGIYAIRLAANDTTGNLNASEQTTFTILDVRPPRLNVLAPSVISFAQNATVALRVNVSDFYNTISGVQVNVTAEGAPAGAILLEDADADGIYAGNLTNTSTIGAYNLTFIATDAAANENRSIVTIRVLEADLPIVTLSPAGEYRNTTSLTLTCDVSATNGLANVTLYTTAYGGWNANQTNNLAGAENQTSFTMEAPEGAHLWNCLATDLLGISDMSVANGTFTIDLTPPQVENVTSGTAVGVGDIVAIEADVSDAWSMAGVVASITLPNGSVQALSLLGGPRYSGSFTQTQLPGQYNITIIATDAAGNSNRTQSGYFIVSDMQPPQLSAISVANGSVNSILPISVAATDDVAVDMVRANVTQPNGTVVALAFAYDGMYRANFSATSAVGLYIVRFIANDTAGNENTTTTAEFIISDSSAPVISSIAAPASANISTAVLVRANISDDVAVSAVVANITLPNGTAILLPLSIQGLYFEGSFGATLLPGNYSLWVAANDSAGNTALLEGPSFMVFDVHAPLIFLSAPANDSDVQVSSAISIAAQATDDVAISALYVNITRPDLVVHNVPLTYNGSAYSGSYTNTTLPGMYLVLLSANDTSGNRNSSTTAQVRVNDVLAPVFATATPNATTYATRQNVVLSANISDDVSVSSALANISTPNATLIVPLLLTEGVYRANFTQTQLPGRYNIAFTANDSSGNTATQNRHFLIEDITAPAFVAVAPSGAQFSYPGLVLLNATLDDDVGANWAAVNITQPNGSIQQIVLQQTGNLFSTSFTPQTIGRYNLTFIARDSTGNMNLTGAYFTVIDVVAPQILLSSPPNGTIGSIVTIGATATDDILVSTVRANITLPNSSVVQLILQPNGTAYAVNFTGTSLPGTYAVLVLAQDSSGNERTNQTEFSITDVSSPMIADVFPAAGSASVGSAIAISANITDDVAVAGAIANVTLPNGTTQSFPLTPLDGRYSTTMTPLLAGRHNITIAANDAAGNAALATEYFIAFDVLPPIISNISPNGTTYNISNNVALMATISDDTGVVQANATITLPNSTIVALPLSYNLGAYHGQFNMTLQVGRYNTTINAADAAGNSNSSQGFFLVADVVAPSIVAITPANASTFNRTAAVPLAVNVTDDVGIGSVLAIVALPNGSTVVQALVLDAGWYVASFGATNSVGRYNFSMQVNDTSVNTVVVTGYFLVRDVMPPAIQPKLLNGTYHFGTPISLLANLTDDVAISTVWANILLPNGSTQRLLLGGTASYAANFTPQLLGVYNVTIAANDTSGNNIAASAGSFAVDDTIAPNITLQQPVAAALLASSAVTFTFNASDNYDSVLACELFIDELLNRSANSSIAVQNLSQGLHTWRIACTDLSANQRFSELRNFTIDTQSPTFLSLATIPADEDGLDPGAVVNISASLSDSSGLGSVLLQHRRTDETEFTNTSMAYDNVSGYFKTGFLPQTGTYLLRLYANDTLGNKDFSNTVNITVQLDRTWSVPQQLIPATVNLSANVTIANLTISNTGDFPQNFSISSDYNGTQYNETFPLQLGPGEQRTVAVSIIAPSVVGATVVTLQTTAADANSTRKNTTILVLISGSEPFLVTGFAAVPSNIVRGSTNVPITATLRNIGGGMATNVSFSFILPQGWVITAGEQNITLENFDIDEVIVNTIEFSVPANTPAGAYTLRAAVTGINMSGADLTLLNMTLSAAAHVTVIEPASTLGSGGGGGGGGGGGAGGAGGGNGGSTGGSAGGGGGGGGGGLPPDYARQLMQSQDSIDVLRGDEIIFPINITNIFGNNTRMINISLEVEGLLSQYITHWPNKIAAVGPGEGEPIWIKLTIPTYRQKEQLELDVIITGKLQTLDEQGRVISTKAIVERRTVTLNIREVSAQTGVQIVTAAESVKAALLAENITSARVDALLGQIQEALTRKDYERVKQLNDKLVALKDTILQSKELLLKLRQRVEDAKRKGLDIGETEKTLVLAQRAYDAENYELALKRAKQAELIEFFETKGAFNPFNFLLRYWWAMLLGSAVLLLAGIILYNRFLFIIINKRMNRLVEEEASIEEQIKELQETSFQDHKMSMSAYYRQLYELEKRLAEIKSTRSDLRIKRMGLTNPRQELRMLESENLQVLAQIKQAQIDYFQKKTINRKKYDQLIAELKLRLVEIEESMVLIRTKMAKSGMTGDAPQSGVAGFMLRIKEAVLDIATVGAESAPVPVPATVNESVAPAASNPPYAPAPTPVPSLLPAATEPSARSSVIHDHAETNSLSAQVTPAKVSKPTPRPLSAYEPNGAKPAPQSTPAQVQPPVQAEPERIATPLSEPLPHIAARVQHHVEHHRIYQHHTHHATHVASHAAHSAHHTSNHDAGTRHEHKMHMPAASHVAHNPPKRTWPILEPRQYFYLSSGQILTTLEDLADALPTMEPAVFGAHVTAQKNDFARWIAGVYQDEELAKRIIDKPRQEIARILKETL